MNRTVRQAATLAVLVVVAVALHRWYGLRNNFFDLFIYRDAVSWWHDGNFLYEYWRPDGTQGRLEFTYPPVGAWLLRPLALLTVFQTKLVYTAVSLAAFAVSVWLLVTPLARRYGWTVWFTFGVAFVLATGPEPIRHSYDFGQINFIIWALVLVDLLVLLPRRSAWTGVLIGLATAIKLVPGIFIVYLLVTRRWRAAGMATAAAVGTSLLAAAFAPHESWVFWSERVLHGDGVGKLAYTFNQSILGTLARFAAPEGPSLVLWLVLAAAVAGYGLWRAGRAAAAGDEVVGLTLTGLVGSLVSPVTWVHHIFWIIPALVVITDAAIRPDQVRTGARSRAVLIGLGGLTYLTVTFSVISWWEFNLGRPGGPVGLVLSNWLVLLMLALLVMLPVRAVGTDKRPQVAV